MGYSEKQSYWGGFFTGKKECLNLTTNAPMSDGWDGLPKGFNWKEYRRGFKAGWKEGKLLHQHKEPGTPLNDVSVANSEFAQKMLTAVEEAEKVY